MLHGEPSVGRLPAPPPAQSANARKASRQSATPPWVARQRALR